MEDNKQTKLQKYMKVVKTFDTSKMFRFYQFLCPHENGTCAAFNCYIIYAELSDPHSFMFGGFIGNYYFIEHG